MSNSTKLVNFVRELMGIGENVSFFSVAIEATVDGPIRIHADMGIDQAAANAGTGAPVVVEAFAGAPLAKGAAVVQVPEIEAKKKRKYTRHAEKPEGAKRGPKPKAQKMSKADRLDPTRTFTTSEDDIKLMRTYIYNWRRYPGAITEDQLRALKPTEGIHAGKMSDVQKSQLLNIFNDVREARGLIKS